MSLEYKEFQSVEVLWESLSTKFPYTLSSQFHLLQSCCVVIFPPSRVTAGKLIMDQRNKMLESQNPVMLRNGCALAFLNEFLKLGTVVSKLVHNAAN